MKKPTFVSIVLALTIALLSVVHVVVSNSVATTGVTLSLLERELSRVKRENALLSEKVLVASSFTNISSRAASLGFAQRTLARGK